MSNGELQPKKHAKKDQDTMVRKGRVFKQIQRTLSTAKFEGIVITETVDEEIEWETQSDRERKMDNWNTVLIREFKKTHDRVLEELELGHKKAYFKNYLADRDLRPEPGTKAELDDLDRLNTLR